MSLNGRARISLHWLGAFVVGFITCMGILYEIRRMEIADIEKLAQERAIVAATVVNNQAIMRKVETRQEWVIRIIGLMAQKMGIKPDELPPEPQPPAEGWQKRGDDRINFDRFIESMNEMQYRPAKGRR